MSAKHIDNNTTHEHQRFLWFRPGGPTESFRRGRAILARTVPLRRRRLTTQKMEHPDGHDDDVWAVFGSDSSSSQSSSGTERSNSKNNSGDPDGLVVAVVVTPPFVIRPLDFQVFEHPPPLQHHDPTFEDNSRHRHCRPTTINRGLRCLRSYQRGDEILRERPIILVPNFHAANTRRQAAMMHQNDLNAAFGKLSTTLQSSVMALSICEKYYQKINDRIVDFDDDNEMTAAHNKLHGIYQTNSYRLSNDDEISGGGQSQPLGGLFLTIARVNHSCRPNASHYWRSDLNQLLLFATTDIHAGDELMLSYLPSATVYDTSARRAFLAHDFAFYCHCPSCQEGNATGGDDRMTQLARSLRELADRATTPSTTMPAPPTTTTTTTTKRVKDEESVLTISLVEQCLSLLRQQGLDYGCFTKTVLKHGYQLAQQQQQDDVIHYHSGGGSSNNVAQDYLERLMTAIVESEGVGSPNAVRLEQLRLIAP
jgi:hypothetical protein